MMLEKRYARRRSTLNGSVVHRKLATARGTKLVLGVTFNDVIEVIAKPTDRQPATAAA